MLVPNQPQATALAIQGMPNKDKARSAIEFTAQHLTPEYRLMSFKAKDKFIQAATTMELIKVDINAIPPLSLYYVCNSWDGTSAATDNVLINRTAEVLLQSCKA